MDSQDMQAKLDKLERLEQSNRDRVKKYLERQKEAGKKQISGLITEPAYNELCRLKDSAISQGLPATTGDIISAALLPDPPGHDKSHDPDQVEVDPVPEPVTDWDTLTEDMQKAKRDNFILDNHKKGGRGGTMSLSQIAQGLMDAGIKTSTGLDKWVTGNVDQNFRTITREAKP